MNRRIFAIITGVIFLAVVIGAIAYSNNVSKTASYAPTKADLKVGDVAPPFQVSSTAGYFDSTTANQPILLEVFATWCIHCQHETATLNDLQNTYGDKIKIIAVNGSAYSDAANDPESQAHVIDFAQKFKVTYPIAYDPELTVAGHYLLGGFPTIVLITKGGRIASISSGEIEEAALKARVLSVL